jgi:hypothetical protein
VPRSEKTLQTDDWDGGLGTKENKNRIFDLAKTYDDQHRSIYIV